MSEITHDSLTQSGTWCFISLWIYSYVER